MPNMRLRYGRGSGASAPYAPTLGDLALSGRLESGVPSTGIIIGATTGSTITSSVPGLTVNSASRTYSYNGAGSAGSAQGLVETLAGATFSPRNNSVTIVAAAPSQSGEMLLAAGQSLNGTANIVSTVSDWTTSNRVKMWSPAAAAFVNYDPNSPPINDPENNGVWGPEVAYAQEWLADAVNAGKTLYIVKHWQGGSQLGAIATYGRIGTGSFDWAPATSNGNWSMFKAKVQSAKAALATAGVAYTIRDMLWIQGETDSRGVNTLADYTTNAGALYQAARSDLADASLRIVAHFVSQYYSDYPRGSMAAKQKAVAAANAPAFIIDTYGFGYQTDLIHTNTPGTRAMGSAAYKLTHGSQFAPANLQLSGSTVSSAALAGTPIGQVSASLNGATTYSVTNNANFEVVGSELRVASGATLTAGTVALTIRAVNGGGAQDFSVNITVTQAAAGGVFLTDEFTMPAGQALTSHTPEVGGAWKKQSGANDVPAGNAAGDGIISTAVSTIAYNDAVPPNADYFAEAVVTRVSVVASQTCGVTVRAKSDAATYFYWRYNNATGEWQLGRVLNGSVTAIAAFAATVIDGQEYLIRLNIKGQVVTGSVDGVARATGTDNSGPTLAGFAGVRMSQVSDGSTGWQIKRITTGTAT